MNLNSVISVCLIAVSTALVVALIYVIIILSNIKNILKPINRMANELGNEFKPLMNDMSGIISSLNSFFGRFDRITGLLFGKMDMVAQGTETVASFFQRLIKNPKVEIEVIGAALKKGISVLFGKKGSE